MNYNNGYVEAELARVKPLAEQIFRDLVRDSIHPDISIPDTVEGEIALAAYQEYLDYQLSKRSCAV